MIRIILCEGKTDAILLSYYLERTKGWEHDKKPKYFKLEFPETDNRFVGHYKNGTEKLSICAVGGKDNFINFYKENLEEYIKDSESLDLNYKLAIVVDRDDRTTREIEQYLSENLKPCIDQITDGVWTSNSFVNNFGQEATIEKLCVIIPHENQGALENLLMDALSEEPYATNNDIPICRLNGTLGKDNSYAPNTHIRQGSAIHLTKSGTDKSLIISWEDE